jgi:hypothetical protein
MWLRRLLPEYHLSPESRDTVKLSMGLVATMSALLLGLLVSSAKTSYDTMRGQVIQMASKVAMLDRVLGVYGPEGAELRRQMRSLIEEQMRRMWPGERTAPTQARPQAQSGDGFQYKLTVQPVIPISLSEDWNVISRTIIPYVYQEHRLNEALLGKSQSGLADTTQSLFFSPTKPARGGWIWGVGPVLQIPTATDDLLGEEKWGAGPTAVILKQEGHVTYGALVNHVWSFAGEENREDVNRTFLQPFVSYTTKTFTSFGVNTESSYDWVRDQWTVPIHVFVQQLLKVGKQPISLQLGGRYYAEGPSDAPEWGLRFQVSFLFPK